VRIAIVDRCDRLGRSAGDRSRQADAEDCIDDDIHPTQAVRVPRANGAARRKEIIVGATCVALQSRRLVQADRDNI
jgi:hypothetical protein